MTTTSELKARGEREIAAEAAARVWISAKEHIFETGVASAAVCGFRQLSDGTEDFLVEIFREGDETVREVYASGVKVEYSAPAGAEFWPVRENLFRTKNNFRVTFPDGGVVTRDGGVTRYTAPSGTCLTAKLGRAAVRINKSARLFAKAERVVRCEKRQPAQNFATQDVADCRTREFLDVLWRGTYHESENPPRPKRRI